MVGVGGVLPPPGTNPASRTSRGVSNNVIITVIGVFRLVETHFDKKQKVCSHRKINLRRQRGPLEGIIFKCRGPQGRGRDDADAGPLIHHGWFF